MYKNENLFEVEGRKVLGFDTGLDPVAFAQAKLAQLLSESGYIVSPSGAVSPWRAEGVVERDGRMTIWGPAFTGERLDGIAESAGDLDALRRWIAARITLVKTEAGKNRGLPAPYPAAAYLGKDGSIFFPPERLALRALDARGERLNGAERWTHPDLSGEAAESFTAGALAYMFLCGEAPFGAQDADAVRADMRDGYALPALLAEPGLDPALASLIDAAIAPPPRTGPSRGRRTAAAARPQLARLAAALGDVGSGGAERFVRKLTEEEEKAAEIDRSRRTKSRDAKIGAKRFARRNATIIVAALAVTIGAVLVVRSILVDRGKQPTTAGMSPRQVVEAYYEAFGALDHTFMEACVTDKAGRGDIESTMNLFVISRVRQAYEQKLILLSAKEWLAQGSPEVEALVYGTTNIEIEEIETKAATGEATLRARYVFWYPASGPSVPAEDRTPSQEPSVAGEAPASSPSIAEAPPQPQSERREDTLKLVLRDGLWRISAIERKTFE